VADREVFGIKPRDYKRTPAPTPTDTGRVDLRRTGMLQYDAIVIDDLRSKRKLPPHAKGNYLYLAISEVGTVPEDREAYRNVSYSSSTRHELHFASTHLGKQANLYVRYSNRAGKQGPAGPIASFFIS
jgi:hypothetical protein